MRFKFTAFLFFAAFYSIYAQEDTPLSGVINIYAAVSEVDPCNNSVLVDDPAGFQAGTQVILIQMQGATINPGRNSNDSNFGTLTDLGEAGLYEKNKIVSVSGNRIVLERTLLHAYDTQNALQLVSMPVYDNAITVDTVKAMPWNGSKGGVLAFEVLGELKVDAPISTEGQGFRGGAAIAISENDCSFINQQESYYFNIGNWRGAPKGESIAKFITDREWGRGNQASGGGGGNDHNSGGGGGANITSGGIGGRNNVSGLGLCLGNDPGLGGVALPEQEDRVYMGGGGGSGHSNNTVTAVGGGNGGGIIIIKSPIITRIFGGIYADGKSVGTGGGDGVGGAGAGGTILLDADSLSGNILVHTFGGNGGTVNNVGINASRCFGPGGGGSGGRIMLTQMVSLPNTSFQVTGGQAGRSINSTNCPDGNNGATPGQNGKVTFFSGLAESPDLFEIPAIVTQPTLVQACIGNPVLLEVETTGENLIFQWQINQGSGFRDIANDATFSGTRTPSLSITEASADILGATFRLIIRDGCGGEVISEIISLEEGVLPNVNFNISINNLDLTVISITPDDASEYLWDFGDGTTSSLPTPAHTYQQGGDYSVKVVVRNACGVDSLAQLVPVRGSGPTAGFSYSDTTGCAPVTVNFLNESTPDAVSFQWTFLGGVPATSMEENPAVRYEAPGSFQVRLIVTDINGMPDTLIQRVNVVFIPEPTADFEFAVDGLNVSFNNLSLNADDAFWDFGDGATSTETNPTHDFPETGSYEVQLIVTNVCGSDTLLVGVDVERPPGANFAIEKIEGCSPVIVSYRNTSTGDYDRLAWSFQGGDPDFSTEENPVVTYSTSGRFEVILVAFNGGGSTTAIKVIDITILDPPIAGFNLAADNLSINIQDNALNADSLCWLIAQDTGLVDRITGPLSTYTFNDPGTYQISQIAKNSCGADTLIQTIDVNSAPVADFEFDTNSGCVPLSINIRNNSTFASSFEWIFEGGQPAFSEEPEPSVLYTQSGNYEWTLIAINESGRDTLRQTIRVDVLDKPQADYEQQLEGILTLSLKSQAIDADSICWLIGDEVFPRLAIDSLFNYVFPAPGTYEYGQVAKNECGADTLRSVATFDGIPIPAFTVSADTGCAPVTVEVFSAYFSSGLSQYLEGFEVTALDGGGFTDPQQEDGKVVFQSSSVLLELRMKVSSPFGQDSLILVVPIAVEPQPTADFLFSNSGFSVNFNNAATNADRYSWDFGDGNTSSSPNPSHTYAELGDYNVSLMASNDCGTDTLIQNVRVNIAPIAAFDIEKNGDCAPFQIQLRDQSQGLGNVVNYEFAGVPVIAIDETNGLYEVRGGGELSITMRVTNELGTDELIQTLSVGVAPKAVFSSQTNNLTVLFQDQSSNADQVRWDFGDGNSSSDRSPTHLYPSEGEYTVRMIVSNDCGEDTLTRVITAGEVLEAKFIAINSFGCAPHLVQFRNRSTGNVSSIEWSFPGGVPATSTEQEPAVLYTSIGSYPVTLKINGPIGSSTVTIDEMIRIVTFPMADFSYEVDGFQVRFTNLSENAEGYRWDFGDGTSSLEENPVHTFTRGGVFSVTLNATVASCGSSVTMNIPVMLSDAEDVFSSEDVKVFPNPTRGNLFVESRSPGLFPLTFELISAQGQLLMRRELNQPDQIDLHSFPTGVYYIRMSNEEKQWVGKLMKLE